MNSGEQLCLACGLCCDGTLFDNVRLESAEEGTVVKALGLPVKTSRGQIPFAFFRQPCSALGDCRICRIYANRPGQCRSFDCQVLKDAQAGRITFDAAHRWVKQAQRKAGIIRRLLRQLGDSAESRSLGDRYRRLRRRVESEPIDEQSSHRFAALSLAMHQLDLLAHRKFHTRSDVI